jgi:hypothetical protein
MAAGASAAKLTAFSFHPDYRPGLILFNYNRRNFQSLSGSPFNDPITNARFFALGGTYSSGKWSHGFKGIYATALTTANSAAGGSYYNSWDGYFKTVNANAGVQDKGLGVEFDYLLGYQWDDSIHFGLDTGLLFPGKFYEFSNSATKNTQKTVFATALNLSVKF